MRLPIALLAALACASPVLGCARPAREAPALRLEDLGLPPAPTTAARLEITGDLRQYAGPARLEVRGAEPLHLLLEDLALAEPVEILVESRAPVRFGRPAGAPVTDAGTFLETDGKLLISLQRSWDDGAQERIVVVGRVAPVPQAPPRDWMTPGTTLYYGLSYDDKPITRTVPMGLMVTVQAAPDGGRVLSWQADVDPDAEVEDTTQRRRGGRRTIPPEVAERGPSHSDRFLGGEDTATHTSVFIPRQARRTLGTLGAAAWQDADAPGTGLLTAEGTLTLTIQADDALWRLPATVAKVADSGARYVIADDPQDPLILWASRPGWTMRLLAIGRPVP
ncbi:hypothetical protein L6R53_30835 [Myxococcota bacterium]|nr:hypothetical protein [Myxococcota bacterium]